MFVSPVPIKLMANARRLAPTRALRKPLTEIFRGFFDALVAMSRVSNLDSRYTAVPSAMIVSIHPAYPVQALRNPRSPDTLALSRYRGDDATA
jgi:hypothetical protein